MFTEVKDGAMIGEMFNLGGSYILQDGRTICGIEHSTPEELLSMGIYEIIEELPVYDQSWQRLGDRTFKVNDTSVSLTYTVENATECYPNLLQQRLETFAKEKDIDFNEIGLLTQSPNLVWQEEAKRFSELYTESWEVFYANKDKTWGEIKDLLPALSWQ